MGDGAKQTDACFVRLLCSWAQVQSAITTLNIPIEVYRNDDSVIFFVPNVCGHIFLQHLSHGKDQYFLARIIHTVDVFCSHEVRILVPDLLFSHVISGQMDRPLLPLIDLDFLCNSFTHAYFRCPRQVLFLNTTKASLFSDSLL